MCFCCTACIAAADPLAVLQTLLGPTSPAKTATKARQATAAAAPMASPAAAAHARVSHLTPNNTGNGTPRRPTAATAAGGGLDGAGRGGPPPPAAAAAAAGAGAAGDLGGALGEGLMDLWGLDGSQVEDWVLDARDFEAQAALLQSVASAGREPAPAAGGGVSAGGAAGVKAAVHLAAAAGRAEHGGAGGGGRDGGTEGRAERKRQREALTPGQMAAAAAEAREHLREQQQQLEQQVLGSHGLGGSVPQPKPVARVHEAVGAQQLQRPATPGGGNGSASGDGVGVAVIDLMESQAVDMVALPPPAAAAGQPRRKRRRMQEQQQQQKQQGKEELIGQQGFGSRGSGLPAGAAPGGGGGGGGGAEGRVRGPAVDLIELLESQDAAGVDVFAGLTGFGCQGGRTEGRARAAGGAATGDGDGDGKGRGIMQNIGRAAAAQDDQHQDDSTALRAGPADQAGLSNSRGVGMRQPGAAAAIGGGGGGAGRGSSGRAGQPLELKLVMDNKERLRDVDPNHIYGSLRREHQDKLQGRLPEGLVVSMGQGGARKLLHGLL